ncbi:MAG: site-2 protease family protein [Trueperaceae bacterium]
MPDFTLQQLLLRIAAILLITAVHGFALTLAARFLGDRGPEYDGRLTLNPFQQIDLLGGLAMLFFSLGWIRPLRVDSREFRRPRRDALLLTLFGQVATLLFVLLLSIIRPLAFTTLPETFAFGVLPLLNTTISLGIWFTVLNLVPLPPLTGGYLLQAIEPTLLDSVRRYELVFKLAIAALILTGVAESVLVPLYRPISRLVLGS